MGEIYDVPPTALNDLDSEETARGRRRRRGGPAFLRAHAAVRRTVADLLGCDAAALEYMGQNCRSCGHRHGAPRMRQLIDSGLSMSTSHSGDLWMVAVGPFPSIGVDLEGVTADANRIMRLAFTPAEAALMEVGSAVGPRPRFGTYSTDNFGPVSGWVAKEAAAKALGTGLTRDLRSLRWRPASDGAFVVQPEEGGAIRGITAEATPEYRCAVAVLDPESSDWTMGHPRSSPWFGRWASDVRAPWRKSALARF